MLVADRMSKPPVTVRAETGVDEALSLMHSENVRRLPVVDKHGQMVGIVSELDLLKVSPSPATTLSIYEIPYLLSKIKMKDVMTTDVISVTEDTTLEDAARVMADNKIGGVPVLRGDKLVGIITETDLFKVFLEMLGGWQDGIRISVVIPMEKGELAKITGKIAEMGGNILAMGGIGGEDTAHYLLTIRVEDVDKDELTAAMEALGLKVRDSRVCAVSTC
jgi:acetoin utilization protein AcuB